MLYPLSYERWCPDSLRQRTDRLRGAGSARAEHSGEAGAEPSDPPSAVRRPATTASPPNVISIITVPGRPRALPAEGTPGPGNRPPNRHRGPRRQAADIPVAHRTLDPGSRAAAGCARGGCHRDRRADAHYRHEPPDAIPLPGRARPGGPRGTCRVGPLARSLPRGITVSYCLARVSTRKSKRVLTAIANGCDVYSTTVPLCHPRRSPMRHSYARASRAMSMF